MTSLSGTWFNELNSIMVLDDDGAGNLSGTYQSGVGVPLGPCALVGRYDTGSTLGGTALGFIVVWQTAQINANAVTTWSGQYQVLDDIGQESEQIFTMWFLSSVNQDDTDWNSIEAGQDIFTRVQRSAAEVQRFRGQRAVSHPRR